MAKDNNSNSGPVRQHHSLATGKGLTPPPSGTTQSQAGCGKGKVSSSRIHKSKG